MIISCTLLYLFCYGRINRYDPEEFGDSCTYDELSEQMEEWEKEEYGEDE